MHHNPGMAEKDVERERERERLRLEEEEEEEERGGGGGGEQKKGRRKEKRENGLNEKEEGVCQCVYERTCNRNLLSQANSLMRGMF
ncbi:Hypothetical predicted protein [Octopus vulgaris]|uniref:Uncharacterized protein n=1 Tax=Octopus vulgaris TaxID=6645 RepID=A0AA36AZL1_OCTVU|nr:Hypothetical predicted protein [Octopus vulgaris]